MGPAMKDLVSLMGPRAGGMEDAISKTMVSMDALNRVYDISTESMGSLANVMFKSYGASLADINTKMWALVGSAKAMRTNIPSFIAMVADLSKQFSLEGKEVGWATDMFAKLSSVQGMMPDIAEKLTKSYASFIGTMSVGTAYGYGAIMGKSGEDLWSAMAPKGGFSEMMSKGPKSYFEMILGGKSLEEVPPEMREALAGTVQKQYGGSATEARTMLESILSGGGIPKGRKTIEENQRMAFQAIRDSVGPMKNFTQSMEQFAGKVAGWIGAMANKMLGEKNFMAVQPINFRK